MADVLKLIAELKKQAEAEKQQYLAQANMAAGGEKILDLLLQKINEPDKPEESDK